MNPYQIYQQQQTIGTTRIDLLLLLYDKAICHLQQAQEALAQQDILASTSRMLEAQLLVYALANGTDQHDGGIAQNLLRLYEYVLYCLSRSEAGKVQSALRVLTILREGLAEIQPEARALEYSGAIPSLTRSPALQFSA